MLGFIVTFLAGVKNLSGLGMDGGAGAEQLRVFINAEIGRTLSGLQSKMDTHQSDFEILDNSMVRHLSACVLARQVALVGRLTDMPCPTEMIVMLPSSLNKLLLLLTIAGYSSHPLPHTTIDWPIESAERPRAHA